MVSVRLIVVCLTAGLLACLANEEVRQSRVRQEVSELVDQWCAGFESGDLDTMMSFYRDSPELQLVTSRGLQYTGTDEVADIYQEGFEEVKFESAKLEQPTILVTGTSAFVTGDFTADTTVPGSGDKYRIRCRTSFGLAKTDQGWRIMGEHSSPLPGIERLQPLDP